MGRGCVKDAEGVGKMNGAQKMGKEGTARSRRSEEQNSQHCIIVLCGKCTKKEILLWRGESLGET